MRERDGEGGDKWMWKVRAESWSAMRKRVGNNLLLRERREEAVISVYYIGESCKNGAGSRCAGIVAEEIQRYLFFSLFLFPTLYSSKREVEENGTERR